MVIESILKDKLLNAKTRTGLLTSELLSNSITIPSLIEFMQRCKDTEKATCLEALEHFTLTQPNGIDDVTFAFVVSCLSADAPRVKWEAARVIANSAAYHKPLLETALPSLLNNAVHPGTVVRWSAATALGAIALAGTSVNETLLPALQNLMENEEKNSIRKIYQQALKKNSGKKR